MGEINISRSEQEALSRVDDEVLRALIEQCLGDERSSALQELPLHDCGLFVSTKRYAFARALEAYGKAKTDKKRAQTLRDARSAGNALLEAVRQMQRRMATEMEEGERFYVEDLIRPPDAFGPQLSVRISYRWRPSPTESWAYGDITFVYDVDLRPNYAQPLPARKPTAAKQAQERQENLRREWGNLKDQALYAVRDYFQDGRDGADIPKTFQVKPSAYTRGLNNYSARFWLPQD